MGGTDSFVEHKCQSHLFAGGVPPSSFIFKLIPTVHMREHTCQTYLERNRRLKFWKSCRIRFKEVVKMNKGFNAIFSIYYYPLFV